MVFLQLKNKFTGAHHSSFNMVRIDVSGFTFLTDNYSEHSISQIPCLKYSFIYFWYMVYMWVFVYIDIYIHHHCFFFVSLIIWGFAIKLSRILGPLGQHLLVPRQATLQNNQSCSCTHLAEVPRHELCSALLLPWSLGDKSFYKKLTVFGVMNMQWLSLVLKRQSRGWHPPPLWVAAESANELSCSFTHTVCCCGS